jgi:putative peptidoglycan lipid II flippase
VLLNLSIIGAAIFLAPYFDPPIKALAWGVAIGGVAQLALQVFALVRAGLMPRLQLDFRDEGVRRVLRAMGPAVLGVSAAQISVLISTQLAALLGDGRISWITYADRLMEFPTALLGVALGTVILPSLAQHHSDANHEEYSALLDWGLRLALLLALPAALALWLLSVPLVATLYHYGRFAVNDVWQTRAALLGYAVGLPALILIKILAPGFYARQVMRTPVKVAFVTVIVTQALAVTFAWPLRLGHAGLTLATSLGACLNASVLFVLLRRHGFSSRAQAGCRSCCASSWRSPCSAQCSHGSPAARRNGSRQACGRASAGWRCSWWQARRPTSARCSCWASASPTSTARSR